jgi:ATP-dependent Clp protease ATP-binding subunit ClpC
MFLQLLDEGHLTDGLGRKVNFKNALIIMTSNIGVKEANSFGKSMGFETDSSSFNEQTKSRAIIDKALKKKFKPEFLNRIDEAIIFNSLSKENIREIINVEIKHLEKRLAELKFNLNISEEALDFIVKQGYDEEYGARPLNRAIQHYVEDLVADEILMEVFKEGDTIKIVYSKEQETLVIEKPKKPKKA